MTAPATFWAKVEKIDGGCWLWTGSLNWNGYGQFRSMGVHRWAYREFVGPIPPRWEVDHLCKVRHCVNPAHLEAVTRDENQRRSTSVCVLNANKTHCKHGHPFDEANTYRSGRYRYCRTCRNARNRLYAARAKTA